MENIKSREENRRPADEMDTLSSVGHVEIKAGNLENDVQVFPLTCTFRISPVASHHKLIFRITFSSPQSSTEYFKGPKCNDRPWTFTDLGKAQKLVTAPDEKTAVQAEVNSK